MLAMLSLATLDVACASAPPTGADELRELVAFLDEVYPGPRDPQALAAAELEAEALDEASDDRLVAAAIHRTLAHWNDAHLMGGLPASVATGPVSLVPILPVRIGDRVLVDASDPPLPLGTEFVALEGRPLASLLDDLSQYATVDGGSPAVRVAAAERDFARLAYLELGMRDFYTVTVRRPDGALESLNLPGADGPGTQALENARQSAPRRGVASLDDKPWPFMIELDAETRVLRLPSFGVNDLEGYRERIDHLFAGLRGDETLVLDVRGNSGGFRLHGVAVLRHVLDRDFAQWTKVETRVRAIPRPYRPRTEFFVGSEAAFDGLPWQKEGDHWVFVGDPLAHAMTPAPSLHRGPVVVFVDDATHSAAVEMVVTLLAYRPDTVVIGTETRGGCARHTGELPVVFTTPQSAVPVVVSLFELELVPYEGCTPGRGIQPTVALVYDEAAFLDGRDPYLDALPRRGI